MATYFIADTHFGHRNIIDYCDRPYMDVDCMDAALIDNWNAVVQTHDDVWFLGDFSFHDYRKTDEILCSLRGRKHLITGNHDIKDTESMGAWQSVMHYKRLRVGKKKVVLCHYPMETWHGSGGGTLHFHGHSHGNVRTLPNRYDVGVDATGLYRPLTLEEIVSL